MERKVSNKAEKGAEIDAGKKDVAVNDENDIRYLESFEHEQVTIFYKSQDSFEKQLSYISSGALVLSVGFMKDIIPNAISTSKLKILLGIGWVLLIATLLLNLVSHMIASKYANKTIEEIRGKKYEPDLIIMRNKIIIGLNWCSIGTLILGILMITIFIIKNLL